MKTFTVTYKCACGHYQTTETTAKLPKYKIEYMKKHVCTKCEYEALRNK